MSNGLAGIGPLDWKPVPADKGPQDARVAGAAVEFESLLIGEMLKLAKSADGGNGWLGTGDDQAGASMGEFAEQALAQLLSQQGGFGLKPLIEKGLQAQREKTEAPSEAL